MIFSTPVFLFLFLPAILLGHYACPRFLRNAFLLMASLFFYAWGETIFVQIMIVSILFNFLFGLWVDKTRAQSRGRLVLAVAVGGNLALLITFKYANFLVDGLNGFLSLVGVETIELMPIHLPIGISFFTFQALSYVIDVYRGTAIPQRNPLHLGLYISLFPQLIAGPIIRYHDIAKQIVHRTTSIPLFARGARRFIIGLAKKMLVANVLGEVADSIFAIPSETLSISAAWLGAIAYTFQIYFDFSGYSDMAIGLGHMFGFRFLENFNYPYISQSVTEFWRRWHISLSSWFRDYLYIPLGGSRKGGLRTYRNLITVFFLCGLWHGASWTFVIWGLYHGAFLVLERAGFHRKLACIWRPLRHCYALFVVVVGWVFFRAETFSQAIDYLSAMTGLRGGAGDPSSALLFLNREQIFILAIASVACTPLWPYLRKKLPTQFAFKPFLFKQGLEWAYLAYLVAIFLGCSMKIASSTHNPFLYFRF
jgi:alginate O-acetyltransferase complex protein AlgI